MTVSVIELAWTSFVLYWLFSALHVKKTKRREPSAQRLIYLLVIAFGAWLLSALAAGTFLQRRFVPKGALIDVLAAILTVSGVAFAIWARAHIGQYWSASVALREGHRLIRTGPYAYIRHPIYTGALLALTGTTLAIGNFGAIFFLAIVLAGFTIKARKEETLLAGEFGPAFQEHRSHTGFFLPKFSKHENVTSFDRLPK